MSAKTGDRSRHHRLRKRKIQQRAATRKLRTELAAAAAAPASK